MADNQNNKHDDEIQSPDSQEDSVRHHVRPGSAGEKDSLHGEQPPVAVNRNSELKNLRTLMMISGIGGPFSFLIGGVLLSTISLVCALIALSKFKRLFIAGSPDASRIKRAIVFSIIISSAALVWNVAWVVTVLPEVWEMVKNQDLSGLYGSVSEGMPEKTIWD